MAPLPGSPLRPSDPRELDGYQLLRRLGAGGMGTVYLGRSPAGRRVAVKIVRAELADDPEYRARFRREAEVARRVARYCTAEVLDAVDPPDGAPYLVTEFVDGPSLSETVSRHGPLGSADVERIAVSVASALTVIHAAGLVHRDLKPSNVLLSKFGPRVIDFGVAWADDSVTVTQDLVVGTPAFMAPEQARGQRVTTKADVFSWGGLVIYAATGRRPFGGGAVPAVLYRIVNSDPDLGGLDDGLAEVVCRAMHRDPAERPTAPEIVTQLQALSTIRTTAPIWITPTPGEPAAEASDATPASDTTPASDATPSSDATPASEASPAGGARSASGTGGAAARAAEAAQDDSAASGPEGEPAAGLAAVPAQPSASEISGTAPADRAPDPAGGTSSDGEAPSSEGSSLAGGSAPEQARTPQAKELPTAGVANLVAATAEPLDAQQNVAQQNGAQQNGAQQNGAQPGTAVPDTADAFAAEDGSASEDGDDESGGASAPDTGDDPTVGTGPHDLDHEASGDDFTFDDLGGLDDVDDLDDVGDLDDVEPWDANGAELTVGYLARLESVLDHSGDQGSAERDRVALGTSDSGGRSVSQRTVALRGDAAQVPALTLETLSLSGRGGRDLGGRDYAEQPTTTSASHAWPRPRQDGRLARRVPPIGRLPWTTVISAFSVVVALCAVAVAAMAALDHGPNRPATLTQATRLTIPGSLVGRNVKEAEARLRKAGFAHWQTEMTPDLKPTGTVLAVQPGEGVQVEAADTVVLMVSAGMASVRIPQVIGLTDIAARSNLQDLGLTVVVRTFTGPANVGPGEVAAIDPAAGVEVPPGSTVTISVVPRPGTRSMATVPNVVGKALSDAQDAVRKAGFSDVAVAYKSATDPAGTVTATDPASGTSVAKNATVTLTVSTGPGQTAVPDVAGRTETDAGNVLGEAGLAFTVRQDTGPSTVKAGLVESVDPAAGTQVPLHSSVTITVVSGQVVMPDVRGNQRADAARVLASYGVNVAVIEQASGQPVGTVLSQSVASGSMVNRGSTVTLVVAKVADSPTGSGPTSGPPSNPPTGPPTGPPTTTTPTSPPVSPTS